LISFSVYLQLVESSIPEPSQPPSPKKRKAQLHHAPLNRSEFTRPSVANPQDCARSRWRPQCHGASLLDPAEFRLDLASRSNQCPAETTSSPTNFQRPHKIQAYTGGETHQQLSAPMNNRNKKLHISVMNLDDEEPELIAATSTSRCLYQPAYPVAHRVPQRRLEKKDHTMFLQDPTFRGVQLCPFSLVEDSLPSFDSLK
jgi:hypothetical protein